MKESDITNLNLASGGLKRLLRAIASRRQSEADWLDLLSQLEYVGCRKIVKGVSFERVTLDILKHISEEASHAFLLKMVAHELGHSGLGWGGTRIGELGWAYFQRLDHRISAASQDVHLNYPGVSWAIERRVLDIYPRYLEITQDERVKSVLRRITAQEIQHGKKFDDVEFLPAFRDQMIAIEAELWAEFEQGLFRYFELSESDSGEIFDSKTPSTATPADTHSSF